MPLNLEIIRFAEFVRLGAHGQLDLAASRRILSQLASACCLREIHRAVLDLRAVHAGPTPMLTPEDVGELVHTFREVGFSEKQRLAVLYSADPHGRARLFAFLSTLHGLNVKASDNFEEAIFWLSQGESTGGRVKNGEQEIPVQVQRAAEDRPGQTKPREQVHKESEASWLPGCRRPPRRKSR